MTIVPIYLFSATNLLNLQESLEASGRRVIPIVWNERDYALWRTEGDAPLHLDVSDSLSRRWAVLDATSDPPLALMIDYCRSKGMRIAVILGDEVTAEAASANDAARADLTIVPTQETEARLRVLWNDVLRLPFSGQPYVDSTVSSLSDKLDAWVPLRRVWCYVESTIRTPYNSGIQRLARLTCRSLQEERVDVVPVAWDSTADSFRTLSEAEAAHLAKWNGPEPRAGIPPLPHHGDWLLIAELTFPTGPTAGAVISEARRLGFRVAFVFFDLIPLKLSPLGHGRASPIYSASTARLYECFWRDMSLADAILPISCAAGNDLMAWLRQSVLKQTNLDRRVVPIPLGGEFPSWSRATRPNRAVNETFTVLTVGTLEPRKNLIRLLEAFNSAAQLPGVSPMRLVVAGSQRPHPGYALEVRRAAAASRGVDVRFVEDPDDAMLADLYRNADLVVYASYEEGFGLPILEAAWFGVPCLCHNEGAILETAKAGGAEMVDMLDPSAIADALARLRTDKAKIELLAEEARARPIKTWRDYVREVAAALSSLGPPKREGIRELGTQIATSLQQRDRPLLSICITTYNRAPWLAHTLPRLLKLASAYRDLVEIVVCDNASTDDTWDVINRIKLPDLLSHHRNAVNVGMLGNLYVTASHASGQFIWLLGDDDILVEGAIEDVLEGLITHPDVEMAYLNYATTRFDDPSRLSNIDHLISASVTVAEGGPNRYVPQLRDVATITENLFTAIYACVLRRDHALRAFCLRLEETPFTSLNSAAPTADYVVRMLLDRPAWWVGRPGLVVNMNVSWSRWEPLWRLERLPELYDWLEQEGLADPRLDYYRWANAADAGRLVRDLCFKADEHIRSRVDLLRFISANSHIDSFRESILPQIKQVLHDAAAAGRLGPGNVAPNKLIRAISSFSQ